MNGSASRSLSGCAVLLALALGACGRDEAPARATEAPPAQLPPDVVATVSPGPGVDAMRRGIALEVEGEPLPIPVVDNRDLRRERAYPMQPPTIPHQIDGYQLDRNANKCMDCHARSRAEEFQAVPVSVTHYMDRDENFLAAISPRRYFCTACHVVQHDAKPLVESRFLDIDTLVERDAAARSDAEPAR